ncbi:MAG: heme lyase NrfEFG subunit NrfE, partial [Alphaproteobacteria bacterium]|nr:heme lyase NrfEFG subunit NrfE [Alphaproteobacteria bacterium]
SAYGTALSHFGVGLMVVGIASTTAYRLEKNVVVAPQQTVRFAGYDLTFDGIAPARGPNYVERQGVFTVAKGGEEVITLRPAKRVYRASRQNTTEAGIHASLAGDLYVVLGDEKDDGAQAIKVYFHPLVRFIWLGAVVMFLGGMMSLSDRRLRVGAPRRARYRGAADAQAA